MEDLISVIVPIYNVEKYLNKCVNSIIGQTYKNLEIVLVDDGSPDNCDKICDEYAKVDKRIKVIHKQNGGLSDARNKGINIAKGKYICFIDSDDYINENYIQFLYTAIKKNNVKISQCNIIYVNDSNEELKKIGYLEDIIKSGKEILQESYNIHLIENTVVWNKMYDIELFKNIRYPIGKINEDEYTTYKILYEVEKVAIINGYLYNYRQNSNSIMGQKFNIKRLDALEALEEKMTFFIKNNEQKLYDLTLVRYLELIIEYFGYMQLKISDFKDSQKEIIKKYRNNYWKLIFVKEISIIQKIKWTIFYITPNLVCILKRQPT